MKKLFTIAALFIFMFSLTSYTPNEIGGGSDSKPKGFKNVTSLNIGGGSDSKPKGF